MVSIGIIGMGFVGPIHLETLRRLGFTDIAIATSSRESARAAAEKYGITRFFSDWREVVDDPKIEVIHICTSNELHYPIAKAALLNGKHVVCDKPLTLDVMEAEELCELAERKQRVNAVTFNTAYYPLVQQAKNMIRMGKTGKINYVHGQYLQDWMLYETDYNWRVESRYQGGSRVVGDIGVHCLYLLQQLIGQEITEVYADFNRFIEKRKKPLGRFMTYAVAKENDEYEEIDVDTEDQATMLLKFSEGTKGVFIGGQCCAGKKNHLAFEIFGSEKSLSWNGENPNRLCIGNRNMSNEILMKDFNLVDNIVSGYCDYAGGLSEGFSESWKNLFKNIYHSVKNGCPDGNFPTFRDGVQMQKIVDAAVRSSKEGKWIPVQR